MADEKFGNRYRTKSARALWHDYGGGAYFVTVCTKNREHLFGEIVRCAPTAATVQLTKLGQFLHENLQNVNAHYPYAEIPVFVVMPNHWHAIVFIDGDKTPYERGNAPVETGRAPSLQSQMQSQSQIQMQKTDSRKGWLSVTIGGIKSAVTKFANRNNIDFAWQMRFHDHIIRDQNELNRIACYIENNPQTWENDGMNVK